MNQCMPVSPHFNLIMTHQPPVHIPPPPVPPPIVREELPHFRYSRLKFPTIPLDRQRTNNLHFSSIDEAVSYIARHCYQHYNEFSRQWLDLYIGDCYFYHHYLDKFVPCSRVPHELIVQSYRALVEGRR